MLKRHSQFLKSLLYLFDLSLICLCWIAAYHIRFSGVMEPVTKGIPPLHEYLWLLIPIGIVWSVSFQAFDLYRPRRMGTHVAEFVDVAKASTLSVLILTAITFFLRQYEFSRLVLVYFLLLNVLTLGFSRMLFREGLRFLRRRGYNQRHALIIGTNRLARRVVEALSNHAELGVAVQGYLSANQEKIGERIAGIPVVGTYGNLIDRVSAGIDIVFVCLPRRTNNGRKKSFPPSPQRWSRSKWYRPSVSSLPYGRKRKCSRGFPSSRFRGHRFMDGISF